MREDSLHQEVVPVRDPRTGRILEEIPAVPPGEVAAGVARAREVQSGWVGLSLDDRLRRLEKLCEVVASRSEEIAEEIAGETGKPETEALTEVLVVLESLRHHLRAAPGVMESRKVSSGWLFWKRAEVEREPLGVVGVISPWNYPFLLSLGPALAALTVGNAAVIKPSEHASRTGLKIRDLWREAGLPQDLLQVLPGDGRTGEALVRAGVDKVVFMGSPESGRRVMATASESLTPLVLELGGKDPAVVLEDADLERAARGVVFGGCYNAGQTCLSTERVYVVDGVYEEFVRLLQDRMGELRAGSSGEVDVGPLTVPGGVEEVEAQVRDAVERGARVRLGGSRTDPASNVFLPTLLVDVESEMRVMREEVFGPVLPVMRVRDEEEAVERVNAVPFGLFASVWAGDRQRGKAVARRLRAGGVSVNDTLSHMSIPGLPMGGTGESGFGGIWGREGLREMSRPRSVLVSRGGLSRDPWWFPYGPSTERLVRALIAYQSTGGPRGVLRGLRVLLPGGRR